jgi:CubicO group peptidase (beta-lactamase class C family)
VRNVEVRTPLPAQPPGVPWPTDEWPHGDPPPGVDVEQLGRLADVAFERPDLVGATHALVVVHGGRIVVERYGSGTTASTTLLSWSMAKSITHAAAGILVRDGRLDVTAPAPVAAWQQPGDPRRGITVEHLLRMVPGLRFVEDYVDDRVSDVIRMLFGDGADDVAGFAASFPLEHPPGTHFNYSSGTTNILARIVGDAVGGDRAAMEAFLQHELFAPTGMRSAVPRFDARGTFVGSSYVYATARDFARFGLLYLRGGTWDGHEVVTREWVEHARTPTTAVLPPGETRRYGAHWWLWDDPFGTFAAHGYEGQRIAVVPALDLVVVRLGRTTADHYDDLHDVLAGIVACFAGVGGPRPVWVASASTVEEDAMTDTDESRFDELRTRGEEFSATVQREVATQVSALREQVAALEEKVAAALRDAAEALDKASASQRAAARKAAKRKTAAKRKASAKKAPAKKAPAKKAPAKKAPAKRKAPAKKSSARKKAPAKRSTGR